MSASLMEQDMAAAAGGACRAGGAARGDHRVAGGTRARRDRDRRSRLVGPCRDLRALPAGGRHRTAGCARRPEPADPVRRASPRGGLASSRHQPIRPHPGDRDGARALQGRRGARRGRDERSRQPAGAWRLRAHLARCRRGAVRPGHEDVHRAAGGDGAGGGGARTRAALAPPTGSACPAWSRRSSQTQAPAERVAVAARGRRRARVRRTRLPHVRGARGRAQAARGRRRACRGLVRGGLPPRAADRHGSGPSHPRGERRGSGRRRRGRARRAARRAAARRSCA